MNREALSVLNLPEDVIGRNATEVALSNDLLRRLLRELCDERKDAEKEPLKIYADNKESYFQMDNTPLYITPVGGREQQFVGNLIILNNITKFKELDSAKTNFISTVSHEMKTPISSILMSLQLLGDDRLGKLNDEQKQLVGSIRESSDRLLSITGELLNMTQIETGKLKLMPKITKPIELIDYAVKATQVLADRFCCFVEIDYPEKISKLFVDNEKIAWVITNLLSNAIHHSPEKSRIVIGAVQHDKAVEIYVQDFGRGIDPRYHKSIFERYFRVPGTKVQGSGLGLAISKEFVEAHGGTISVESEIGRAAGSRSCCRCRYGGLAPGRYRDGLSEWEQTAAARCRQKRREADRCEQNEKRTQSRHQCAADSNAPMPPNTKPPQNRSAAASHYRFSCFKCST